MKSISIACKNAQNFAVSCLQSKALNMRTCCLCRVSAFPLEREHEQRYRQRAVTVTTNYSTLRTDLFSCKTFVSGNPFATVICSLFSFPLVNLGRHLRGFERVRYNNLHNFFCPHILFIAFMCLHNQRSRVNIQVRKFLLGNYQV